MRARRPTTVTFALIVALAAAPAQTAETKTEGTGVDAERITAAFADARAACAEILGVKPEAMPPLLLVGPEELAHAVADENLPAVSRRESDAGKARAAADQLGAQVALTAYAKYSWSRRQVLVVCKTWNLQALALAAKELTADATIRAVLVHECCHAIDDQRFDFTSQLPKCDSLDAVMAFSAVMEGHAQLLARRVCTQRGWGKGFESFTAAIGALPDVALDEITKQRLRAESAAMRTGYHDGEKFVAAVVAARPDNGERDLFLSPPRDLDTVLHPRWYLEPESRPKLLHDAGPALDAFAARFDADVWSNARSEITGRQLASGLSMLPPAEVEAFVASLRAATIVSLAPTDAPQSKTAYLAALEFDSEASAHRWIELCRRVSDHKDKTMNKGAIRIVGSKTTPIEREGMFGLLQEKQMQNGRLAFDVAAIDAQRGCMVLESLYSGEPPPVAEHQALVEELLGKIKRRE